MKPTGWAFIGAGGIATSVAKRIFKSGRHRLVAVYNRTESKAQKLAERFGGKAFGSLEDAINDPAVDCVYVNVTNNVHYEYCKRALECGKPILLEKPFTTDAAQARELFALAEKSGTYLCEAMWTWFSDQANALKTAIDNGEIGKITGGEISLCLPIAFSKNNRLLQSSKAGGALLDLGVYPITYAYRLFGKPKGLECRAKFKLGVDVSDDVIMKYDGFAITAKASVTSLRGSGERLIIRGETGTIKSGAFHSGGGFKITGNNPRKFPSDRNAMLTEFDRVAQEVKEGRTKSAFVPPEATIDVMDILDEVRKTIGLRFEFEN